jgi:diaminohydroxyphosphoribosylaminopyrimidine deaminase/5-amino-6-(5-phosphoribosylamino)uracil reductase
MAAPTVTDADRRFMRRALELAETGWGRVHPNPLVGAVVVREGGVVGEGAHREFGGPHAEVEALRAAGEAAVGATLYVTLEPCAHQGKTPPCTVAVLDAGIRRVVYAASDPNPEAMGGGEWLAARGVEVVPGVERERARRQNALFLGPIEGDGPYVALKLALTLDGAIARREGERTAITGPETQAEVHRLRSGFDAVMVGARTARTDDPLLTVRAAPTPRVPPTRVVVDPRATLPDGSALLNTLDEAPVAVVVGPAAEAADVARLRDAGADVLEAPAGPGGLALPAVLQRLREGGLRTVFCEGGGRLGSSLLNGHMAQRLYLFYGPRLFGQGAVPGFPGVDGFNGTLVEARPMGADVMMVIDRSE